MAWAKSNQNSLRRFANAFFTQQHWNYTTISLLYGLCEYHKGWRIKHGINQNSPECATHSVSTGPRGYNLCRFHVKLDTWAGELENFEESFLNFPQTSHSISFVEYLASPSSQEHHVVSEGCPIWCESGIFAVFWQKATCSCQPMTKSAFYHSRTSFEPMYQPGGAE